MLSQLLLQQPPASAVKTATPLPVEIGLSISHEISTKEIRSPRIIAQRTSRSGDRSRTSHLRGATWAFSTPQRGILRAGNSPWSLHHWSSTFASDIVHIFSPRSGPRAIHVPSGCEILSGPPLTIVLRRCGSIKIFLFERRAPALSSDSHLPFDPPIRSPNKDSAVPTTPR